jgi:hypothetical protein
MSFAAGGNRISTHGNQDEEMRLVNYPVLRASHGFQCGVDSRPQIGSAFKGVT